MSDWDTYRVVDNRSPIAVAAEEYEMLSEQKARIEKRLEVLGDQLAAEFVEQPGEQILLVGKTRVITCTRSERWSWDTDTLEAVLAAAPSLPPYVKRSLSVDKRKFEGLDDAEKKALLPALTRKPGKATIRVTQVGGSDV
jgi:hypothetical protein